VNRQQQNLILRLWRDWCQIWPEQYGHESLHVKPEGYDPVFDVIPSQVYKDFYYEVVRGHPQLKRLNAFEVIDTALNHVQAPETPVVREVELEPEELASPTPQPAQYREIVATEARSA